MDPLFSTRLNEKPSFLKGSDWKEIFQTRSELPLSASKAFFHEVAEILRMKTLWSVLWKDLGIEDLDLELSGLTMYPIKRDSKRSNNKLIEEIYWSIKWFNLMKQFSEIKGTVCPRKGKDIFQLWCEIKRNLLKG